MAQTRVLVASKVRDWLIKLFSFLFYVCRTEYINDKNNLTNFSRDKTCINEWTGVLCYLAVVGFVWVFCLLVVFILPYFLLIFYVHILIAI